jgi:hypothetical protein
MATILSQKFKLRFSDSFSRRFRLGGNVAKLTVLLLLILIAPTCANGQSLPSIERQKIEALIERVGSLKDAKFVRNGSPYEPSTAVRFLRGKWSQNHAQVKSARDFIDKVASVSGTSGKPYLIRFKDGKEIESRDYLLAELNRMTPPPAT